jgi:hypothetical protein
VGSTAVETWRQKRNFKLEDVIEQFNKAAEDADKAAIVARAQQLFEAKRLSGTRKEQTDALKNLWASKVIRSIETEYKKDASRNARFGEKARLFAVLKIAENNEKELEELPVTTQIAAKVLLDKVKFERQDVNWRRIVLAVGRGAIIGAIGGAIGAYLVDKLGLSGGEAAEIVQEELTEELAAESPPEIPMPPDAQPAPDTAPLIEVIDEALESSQIEAVDLSEAKKIVTAMAGSDKWGMDPETWQNLKSQPVLDIDESTPTGKMISERISHLEELLRAQDEEAYQALKHTGSVEDHLATILHHMPNLPADKEAVEVGAALLDNMRQAEHLHSVGAGDTAWRFLDRGLQIEGQWEDVASDGQKIYIVDHVKDWLSGQSPERIKELGIPSGDISQIQVGQELDLGGMFEDEEFLRVVAEGKEKALALSPESIESGPAETPPAAAAETAAPEVAGPEAATPEAATADVPFTEVEVPGAEEVAPAVPVAPDISTDATTGAEAAVQQAEALQPGTEAFEAEVNSRIEESLKNIYGEVGVDSGEWKIWKSYGAAEVLRMPVDEFPGNSGPKLYEYIHELAENTGLEPETHHGQSESLEHFVTRAESASLAHEMGLGADQLEAVVPQDVDFAESARLEDAPVNEAAEAAIQEKVIAEMTDDLRQNFEQLFGTKDVLNTEEWRTFREWKMNAFFDPRSGFLFDNADHLNKVKDAMAEYVLKVGEETGEDPRSIEHGAKTLDEWLRFVFRKEMGQ